MQRLFSMFPRGAPGVALLLLRLSLAVELLLNPHYEAGPSLSLPDMGRYAAVLLLVSGLFTPLAAGLGALITLLQHIGSSFIVDCMILVNATILGLIGPGAYAIDARLFGRRRVVFEHSLTRAKPKQSNK
jgi:hypothetical protein